jgi:hypothetical protein
VQRWLLDLRDEVRDQREERGAATGPDQDLGLHQRVETAALLCFVVAEDFGGSLGFVPRAILPVHREHGFAGGRARREAELVDLHDLPSERDREEHAQERHAQAPTDQLVPDELVAEHLHRGDSCHEPRRRSHRAGRRPGGLRDVGLEHAQAMPDHREEGKAQHRRNDRSPKGPTDPQANVDVGAGDDAADQTTDQHGAEGELPLVRCGEVALIRVRVGRAVHGRFRFRRVGRGAVRRVAQGASGML